MISNNEIWVFLSHSNKDYEKVRILRNLLEDNGFRPIMLYLRSKEDPAKFEELKQLIFDEIDHRNRFIYCKSPNAEQSTWVDEEIKHLEQTNRGYDKIDIDSSDEAIKGFVENYRIKASIFISYSRQDSVIAEKIYQRLKKYDSFIVYYPPQMLFVSESYANTILDAIEKTKRNGFYIVLLSKDALQSQWLVTEISMALENNSKRNIIPIVTDNDIIGMLSSNPVYVGLKECNMINMGAFLEEEKIDRAVDKIIERLFTPGDILALANQFRDGVNGICDNEEAQRLYQIFFCLAEKSENPITLYMIGECYEYGYGVDVDLHKAYYYYSECRNELGGKQKIGKVTFNEHCQRVYNKIKVLNINDVNKE